MKPKRGHPYYEEKSSLSPSEARALGTILVWGSLIAIFVLSDRHFGIFIVTAIAATIATIAIWSNETSTESGPKQNKDAQAALHLLELLQEDELELLKSRLRAQIMTPDAVIPDQDPNPYGPQILIR